MENKDINWDEFSKGFKTKVPSNSIFDKIDPVLPIFDYNQLLKNSELLPKKEMKLLVSAEFAQKLQEVLKAAYSKKTKK